MRPDDKPACAGKWDLFDSRYPADHEKARELCVSCPVLADCRVLLEQTIVDYPPTAMGGMQGTWAGKHIDPKKRVGRPRKEVAA